MAHGIKLPPKSAVSAPISPEPVASLAQNEAIMEENLSEEEPKIEVHDPATCPNCIASAEQLAALSNTLELAQNRLNVLEASDEAQGTSVGIPEVEEFIEHCEAGNCAHHAAGWLAVKERIIKSAIENIDPTMVPDKVVESEGLRRGFIPQRIVIRGD